MPFLNESTGEEFEDEDEYLRSLKREDSYDFSYRYEAEPLYFFNSRAVFTLMLLLNRLIPPVMKSSLFMFLRKKYKEIYFK